MDWDRLRIFLKIAEIGSFSRAAGVLYVSQSALSRQISLLEKELNCLLFYRVPRGLKLTHKGELLYKTVQDITARLATTEMVLIENKDAPRGMIRVAVTHVLGTCWLSKQLLEFTQRYPDIHFQLTFTDCEVNLASKQFDISMTLSPSSDADFVTSDPIPSPIGIFGSKSYFEKMGIPMCIEDLDQHQLMIYHERKGESLFVNHLRWLIEVGRPPQKPRPYVLSFNSFQGLYYAAQKGLGLVSLPKLFIVPGKDDLIEVLTEEEKPLVSRYVTCTRQSLTLKRVFIFRQYILKKLEDFFQPLQK